MNIALLNYIYNNEKNIEFKGLYSEFPFSKDKEKQYPGNIIQYSLMELAKVEVDRGHDGYSAKEWQEYKKTILRVLWSLIDEKSLETFKSRDCAASLHRLVVILSRDCKFVTLNNFSGTISSLLKKLLHELDAKPQEIANTLWALGKLVEAGKLSTLNATQISDLVAALHQQRSDVKPQNIANTLWALAKLVEVDKLTTLNATDISDLVGALHQQRSDAKPQEIANTLWALGKLVEAGKLSTLNATQIRDLVAALHQQGVHAKPQDIANTLWALGKLVEAGKLSTLNATQISDLVATLHQQGMQTKPQDIANTLWALGKLVEAGKLSTLNATQIRDLVAALHQQGVQTKPQDIANTLWAYAIINNRIKLGPILSGFVIDACHQLAEHPKKSFVQQILIGVYLLNLERHSKIKPHLNSWIAQCQPQSSLNPQEIKNWLTEKGFFKSEIKELKLESFICGYYIDILVCLADGTSCVVEIDGKHHQQIHQKIIDEYRDDHVFAALGLSVIRISSSILQKSQQPSFFSNLNSHPSSNTQMNAVTKSNCS